MSELWNNLEALAVDIDRLWTVMSDFNEILSNMRVLGELAPHLIEALMPSGRWCMFVI